MVFNILIKNVDEDAVPAVGCSTWLLAKMANDFSGFNGMAQTRASRTNYQLVPTTIWTCRALQSRHEFCMATQSASYSDFHAAPLN